MKKSTIVAGIIGGILALFTAFKIDPYVVQIARGGMIVQKINKKESAEREAYNYYELAISNLNEGRYAESIKYLEKVRDYFTPFKHPRLPDINIVINGLESTVFAQKAVLDGNFREALDHIINAKGNFIKVDKVDKILARRLMSKVLEIEMLMRKGIEESKKRS